MSQSITLSETDDPFEPQFLLLGHHLGLRELSASCDHVTNEQPSSEGPVWWVSDEEMGTTLAATGWKISQDPTVVAPPLYIFCQHML